MGDTEVPNDCTFVHRDENICLDGHLSAIVFTSLSSSYRFEVSMDQSNVVQVPETLSDVRELDYLSGRIGRWEDMLTRLRTLNTPGFAFK
jgi:hypothetical protein